MAAIISDAELVRASIDDAPAFAAIFDRHYDAIAGFLLRRLERLDAEEAAAQTFLVAFERRCSFDPNRGSVRSWLFGIANNLARRSRRSEATRLAAYSRLADEPVQDHSSEVIARASAEGHRADLAAALMELSSGERDVLLLHSWTDLSHGEIAAALGVEPGTIKSRLSRARSRLKEALEPIH